jgi:hypothetical protein
LADLTLYQGDISDLDGYVNVELPKGIQFILLDHNPAVVQHEQPEEYHGVLNNPKSRQNLEWLVQNYPPLGSIICCPTNWGTTRLVTLALRDQLLWFSPCGRGLLIQQQQQQPHVPLSAWAIILARVKQQTIRRHHEAGGDQNRVHTKNQTPCPRQCTIQVASGLSNLGDVVVCIVF